MPNLGDTVAHYTLEALLGQGGMGSVYQAHDHKLQRRVALKILASDQGASARVLKEARAVAALEHPNVVVLHEIGEDDGVCYIAMELIQGRTLRVAMNDPEIPQETRLRWLTEIAKTLAAAHERGIVHRDIKPENVMVRGDGSIKVLDFGIARRKTSEVAPTASTQQAALATVSEKGLLVGTPLYMAPEQLRGAPLDGRTDQFAWAVLAYEVLTGKLPWSGGDDALAVIASVLTDPVEETSLLAAGLPAPLRAALLRALRKRPEERFSSMTELLASLEAPSRGAAPSTPPRPARAVTPLPSGRYTTAEVSAILSLAIDRQASAERSQGRFSFDELLEAAREVGIDEVALREASRDLRQGNQALVAPPDPVDSGYLAWKRRQRRGFLRHLGAYAMVNLVFLILGIFVTHVFPMLIPGLFWAIGLGIHGVNVLTSDEDEWREKQERKARRQNRRVPRHERAIEEGATMLLQASADRRLRVAPAERVRVEAPREEARDEDFFEEMFQTKREQRRRR